MPHKTKLIISIILPVFLLGLLVLSVIRYGPVGVFKASVPPIEKIFINKVIFSPEQIDLKVINDGPEKVTISQMIINDVIWQFEMMPDKTLKPLAKGTIRLYYPWIPGNPLNFTVMASDGVTFEKEVPVAFSTPTLNLVYIKSFVLLGLYVGVLPVLLGLLWYPFLKKLRGGWYSFLLALTVGLLLFLGIDAIAESFELSEQVPESYNAIGIFIIGFILAILTLAAVSNKTEHHIAARGDEFKALIWGYLIALGIGLHNLGEGLAIGSAYAVGEISLGGSLVVGFMIHNLTEGVAIISPLLRSIKEHKNIRKHLIFMGILAGIPTIIGTLTGGFAFSPVIALLFFAIGAGAIFDVVFDILYYMANGSWLKIFSTKNVLGFLTGLVIMYSTGILVLQ